VDLVGQRRRLCGVELFGSPAEVQSLGDGDEISHLAEIEVHCRLLRGPALGPFLLEPDTSRVLRATKQVLDGAAIGPHC
jgi:hypothetical protein